MTLLPSISWSFFGLAALALALLAHRTGRAWLPWALLGGTSTLVITTITVGVAEAAFIPLSHNAYVNFRAKVILAALFLNGLCGWLITIGLHQHHVVLARLFRGIIAKVRTGLRSPFEGQPALTPGFPLATQKQVAPCQNVVNWRKTRPNSPAATRHETS